MRHFFTIMVAAFALTACGPDTNADAEKNYTDLESWWDRNTDSLDANTEQGWENFKAEWKELKAKIRRDDLSEEDRAEFDRMDEEVNRRDAENQERWVAQRDNTQVDPKGMEVLLLGDNHSWDGISSSNLKDTYIRFMENVRANNDNWSEADWNAADAIFSRLQTVKDQVDDQMATSDEAKIAALATEYRALETAADIEASASN